MQRVLTLKHCNGRLRRPCDGLFIRPLADCQKEESEKNKKNRERKKERKGNHFPREYTFRDRREKVGAQNH